MKILYLNNFRGFKDTYIPFEDVNFLVGENSTGKSSVLSLIRLMSTYQFWENEDFNTGDIELGSFNELISKNVKGKKEFQLGYHIKESDKQRKRIFNTLLATYKNEKGSPKLNKIRILYGHFNILISISNKQFRYSIKEVSYEINYIKDFIIWVKDTDFNSIPYKIHAMEDDLGIRLSFFDIKYHLKKLLPKEFYVQGLSRPSFLPYSTWIAPIRSKPKRIYESFKLIFSSEGDHVPLLIKLILANQYKERITKDTFSKALENFGNQSGLFDKIEVKNLGKDISSPFILNVSFNGIPLKITNVGYGVGQVLPLLVEILVTRKGQWLSIQQPEVHLHPKAQAALGEFIYEAVSNRDKHFLIETHSDFIIDRFRYCLKNGDRKPTSQVLFFERKEGGNFVTPILIDQQGQYSENQPNSFRDFFINEELNLLTF